jgi:GDPmannose 4,6-dehydratase
MKKALITGINGQAGSYLAEELLEQGYEVHGIVRRSSNPNYANLARVLSKIKLHEGDLTDVFSLSRIIRGNDFTHIFNAAAQSHVHTSFVQPKLTWDVTAQGVLNLLEVVKDYSPTTRFLQFSSSEMFGDQYTVKIRHPHLSEMQLDPSTSFIGDKYQDEDTPMNPQSPYAIAKLAGYNAVRLYRKSYGLFASNVIMFNYESERRGENFVTQKIAKHVRMMYNCWMRFYQDRPIEDFINNGRPGKLKLGNLDAKRDWGYCPDYMGGCRMVLEHDKPDDFVLATGETHSVEEFLEEAFSLLPQKIKWQDFVEISEEFKRPSEVPYLCGKADKIKREIGWEPKVKFKELVKIMVNI